jgi:hypothetical protein
LAFRTFGILSFGILKFGIRSFSVLSFGIQLFGIRTSHHIFVKSINNLHRGKKFWLLLKVLKKHCLKQTIAQRQKITNLVTLLADRQL